MIDIHFKVNKHLDTCQFHSIFVLGIRTVVRFSASEIEMHFPYYWFCVFHCKFDTGMNVVECINEKMNDYSSSLSTILADFEGGRGPLIMTC